MIYKQWAASARAARRRAPPAGLSDSEGRARTTPAVGTRAVACILSIYIDNSPPASLRACAKRNWKLRKWKLHKSWQRPVHRAAYRTIAANELLISESRKRSSAACSAPLGWPRGARRGTSSALRHFCVTCQLFRRRGARARDVSGESRAAGRRRDGVHHAARVHAGDDRLQDDVPWYGRRCYWSRTPR